MLDSAKNDIKALVEHAFNIYNTLLYCNIHKDEISEEAFKNFLTGIYDSYNQSLSIIESYIKID